MELLSNVSHNETEVLKSPLQKSILLKQRYTAMTTAYHAKSFGSAKISVNSFLKTKQYKGNKCDILLKPYFYFPDKILVSLFKLQSIFFSFLPHSIFHTQLFQSM